MRVSVVSSEANMSNVGLMTANAEQCRAGHRPSGNFAALRGKNVTMASIRKTGVQKFLGQLCKDRPNRVGATLGALGILVLRYPEE